MKQILREIRNGTLILGGASSSGFIFVTCRMFTNPNPSARQFQIFCGIPAFIILLIVATVMLCISHECHIRLRKTGF